MCVCVCVCDATTFFRSLSLSVALSLYCVSSSCELWNLILYTLATQCTQKHNIFCLSLCFPIYNYFVLLTSQFPIYRSVFFCFLFIFISSSILHLSVSLYFFVIPFFSSIVFQYCKSFIFHSTKYFKLHTNTTEEIVFCVFFDFQ